MLGKVFEKGREYENYGRTCRMKCVRGKVLGEFFSFERRE